MSGDHSQQLAQLADIHVAAEPGMWPPAPGWWVLGFIALLGILIGLRAQFAPFKSSNRTS